MTSFWHPFADMGIVDGHEFVVERGDGVYIWDDAGTRYLDAIASLWYCNVGYGRIEIADAVAAQMSKLHAYHTFGDFASRPVLELAEKLAAIAPIPASKIFFTSGGSDSIDTAAKLARRYFHAIGQAGRTVVITREWAYHGMHTYGTSIAGMAPNLENYGPLVGDVVKVPWDSADALAAAVEEIGSDRIAAFFCEPVIGAGGVRPAPNGYLKEARGIVHDAGALFVADEVITGFGRVGDWFASNRFSLEPDMITFAKGVTSGYAPLGGVVISPRVAAPFWEPGTMWRHGYTYSGHTSSCVAGLVNLGIIEREGLLERALGLESTLTEALEPLVDLPLVGSLRSGTGVLAAVQLDPGAVASDATLANRVARAVRESGVITRALAGGGLQASPPLTITESQLAEMAAGFRAGITAIDRRG